MALHVTTPSASRRFDRRTADCTLLFWSSRSGSARLCDISEGGFGVCGAEPALTTGDHIPVTVAVGLNRMGPLAARVVWSANGRAGLELDHADPAVERVVSQAIRYLEPHS